MLPALPVANLISENISAVVPLLQQHMEIGHSLQLSRMLQEVITDTTNAITKTQMEAILLLTKQIHDSLAANLNHYMAEQAKYSDLARSSTDPILRQEMSRHVTNIDFQMKRVRRDMETLQRFSGKLIARCGEMGLRFAHDVAIRIK
jgi:hypothetical protein